MEPDYAKYDAAKLRQVLGTIDAIRFPERVDEIEARLAALEQDEQFAMLTAAPPTPPLPPSARIVRRVGQVLIAIGVAKIVMTLGVVAMGRSSSFSLDVLSLIAGILLWRGDLRAASVVRWCAWLGLPATLLMAPTVLALRPLDLTLTELRLFPFAALTATALTIGGIVLTLWVIRELGSAPVLEARAAAGRPVRNMRIPLALGLVFCMAAFGFMMQQLGGDRAGRAEAMAAAQLGAGYRYYVTTMSWMSGGGVTAVNASVVAWNRDAVVTVPVYWKE